MPTKKHSGSLPLVLHVSSKSDWRGGEQQIAYLVEEMHQQQWDPVVLCPQGSVLMGFLQKKGIRFFTFRRKGLVNSSMALAIKKLCRTQGFEIVHAHDPHAHTAAVLAGVLGNETPVVLSRKVAFPVKNSWFSRYKYNYWRIKAIICISQNVKKILEPTISNKSLLSVIFDGVDINKFDGLSPKSYIREPYGIPSQTILVGMVAALTDEKDYPTFIEAARRVLLIRKEIRFVAIGDGPLKSMVQRMINEAGLGAKMFLPGYIKDIGNALQELNLFVLTSHTEGLGTSILDAFACKIPVVATNAGGIPEIVIHEKTGLLAPVKDAETLAQHIIRVVDDPVLKNSLVEGANYVVRELSKENMARKNGEVYLEVVRKMAGGK
jgi:L-malate glycosyltransferase